MGKEFLEYIRYIFRIKTEGRLCRIKGRLFLRNGLRIHSDILYQFSEQQDTSEAVPNRNRCA